jgi:hypothetical protein
MKEIITEGIINEPSSFFASKWIVERIPFLFNSDLDAYIDWKEKLSLLIGVDSKSIVVIGSAAVGISLNPDKNFKEFDSNSDIDVAVISTHHFDIGWHTLRNLGTRIHRLKVRERTSVEDHKNRLIYFGAIATDRIIQLMPFGAVWLDAIDQMRKIEPTIDREINFRIYKDFEALRAYQTYNINKIKDMLLKEK